MLKPLLAAALLSGQAASVPAPTRCINRSEIGDLTLVGASVAVEVVRNACRSLLPETAFLATPAGADFSARLRDEGQRRLDSAIVGITRISGSSASMERAAIRTFLRGMLTEGAGRDFAEHADAALCRDANEIMEIASTLSPDQMARFVGAFASIADHVARMQPPPRATTRTAPPEAAPPRPHPAAFETAPRGRPPVRVEMAPNPHRPPFRPFLCAQPE